LFYVELVVAPLQHETWNFVLGACLFVFLLEGLQVIQLSHSKHAGNLLNCHVNSVFLKQGGYLAHVESIRAVLIELLKHFFYVFLGLYLGRR
jgi:hypothetical protein